MAAITASGNITVTINDTFHGTRHRKVYATLAYVTGTAQGYPAAGIPLPAYGKFGLKREITYFKIVDDGVAATGTPGNWVWKGSVTGKALRAFRAGATSAALEEIATSGAVDGPINFRLEVVGW